MAEIVSRNLGLIVVPLFALLALCIIFLVIPIFQGMGIGASASAGLGSMSNTIANFSPVYGIGLAIGILVLFFGVAAMFGKLST